MPGLVSLIVVPLPLYVIYPHTVKSSPDAPKLAREKLQKMGPMTKNEIIMSGTLLVTVGLWRFGGMLKVDAVTAAILRDQNRNIQICGCLSIFRSQRLTGGSVFRRR
jgi:di/tricarboxylate transporter